MNIKQIKIFPVNEDKLKAVVLVVLEEDSKVRYFRLIQRRDGLFLSTHSRRKKNQSFEDIAHPLSKNGRLLGKLIMEEYRRLTSSSAQ